MSKKKNEIEIILMADNGLETVGGEQESTKIILNSIKTHYFLGIIQPGIISNPIEGVRYYSLTKYTRIKHLIKKPFLFIRYIWNVKNIISEEKPKIIHTQAQVSFFIIALLRKLNLISNNIFLIHTERGLYTKYNKLFKKIFLFFMKELNVLVTTTEFNLRLWRKSILKKGLKLDFNIIENTAGDIFESYNPKFDKKECDFIVGFAGRYTNWKNWPLAVEISEKLYKKLGDKLSIRMVVGCLDDRAEKKTIEMFEHLASLLGDKFKGEINIGLEKMSQYYYDLDVFILTSKYNTESFGRTLVEAMSRRTVVLTTDAGGAVEVVGDKSKVFETADEFVNAVLELFNNKSLLEKIKDENLIRVKNFYSLENNIKKHINLYRKYIS